MSPQGTRDVGTGSADTDAAPATGRPLRRDAARNRVRIVEAALEVFAEQGLQAPIDEVARRAGVGIGTLYRRFSGRDELIQVMPPSPSDPGAYPAWEAIMTPTWWYIRWQDGSQELYRYRDDPWLLEDLAATSGDVVAELAPRLDCLIAASRATTDAAATEGCDRSAA